MLRELMILSCCVGAVLGMHWPEANLWDSQQNQHVHQQQNSHLNQHQQQAPHYGGQYGAPPSYQSHQFPQAGQNGGQPGNVNVPLQKKIGGHVKSLADITFTNSAKAVRDAKPALKNLKTDLKDGMERLKSNPRYGKGFSYVSEKIGRGSQAVKRGLGRTHSGNVAYSDQQAHMQPMHGAQPVQHSHSPHQAHHAPQAPMHAGLNMQQFMQQPSPQQQQQQQQAGQPAQHMPSMQPMHPMHPAHPAQPMQHMHSAQPMQSVQSVQPQEPGQLQAGEQSMF